MRITTLLSFVCAILILSHPATADTLPKGKYTLDKSHASLIFQVSHLGFSNYTAAFRSFDATLDLDPAHPETAKITATVDVTSLELPTPPENFFTEMLGPNWFDAGKYPVITFESTGVENVVGKTAQVKGNLTLHGQTKPVILDVTFNGGYAGLEKFDPNARIGFSAKTSFLRSDFGIAYGIPAPGTTMGVSDKVDVLIEAEFSGPAMAK